MVIPYHEDRPSITLKLQANDKNWKYFTGLIDSGADFSIFPLSCAIALGIEDEKMEKMKVETADGQCNATCRKSRIFYEIQNYFRRTPTSDYSR